MAFITCDESGHTLACCLRGIPEPTELEWIEVPDDDPRCAVPVPMMSIVDPVEKLRAFLAANPDVAALCRAQP
jgi:hypothetical protein